MQYEINFSVSIKIQEDKMNINGLIQSIINFLRYVISVEFIKQVIEELKRHYVSELQKSN